MPEELSINVSPNPFNSVITISVDCRGLINQTPTVEILDLAGRKVAEIPVVDGFPVPSSNGRGDRAPTDYEFVWQPDESVGSGTYLVRAKFGDSEISKRIIYLK